MKTVQLFSWYTVLVSKLTVVKASNSIIAPCRGGRMYRASKKEFSASYLYVYEQGTLNSEGSEMMIPN